MLYDKFPITGCPKNFNNGCFFNIKVNTHYQHLKKVILCEKNSYYGIFLGHPVIGNLL